MPATERRRKPARRRIAPALVLTLALALLSVAGSATDSAVEAASAPWQWYKTDTHVHSVLGGDGYDDYGIIADAARTRGYDALFLTDHQGASSFPIGAWTANTLVFEDTYKKWDPDTFGTVGSTTNALASTPVNTGTSSLHLKSTSTTSGETFVASDRGPNFRSGDVVLKFSVYPTRIDAGSGAYVSVSIGGDKTVSRPDGYTTAAGAVSPQKSTVLVWQLGAARAASTNPSERVLAYPLSYTLNRWNTYTINVSQALLDVPSADRPLDYNAVTQLKMAVAANNGTADAYFDTYSIQPSNPVPAPDEFAYRHGVADDFNTSTFKIFESLEMGVLRHAQRFNFAISDPSQYGAEYQNGVDGIAPTQATGYPTQLNHPGLPGGVTQQEAIDHAGYDADFMEAREDLGAAVMIDVWDRILSQGTQLIGTWSSDMHHVSTLDVSDRGVATNIYAPSLTFEELLHSLFEGRAYLARNTFAGRLAFNLGADSIEPYPARYPVYVPSTQTSASVHLNVSGGLASGDTVTWVVNGTPVATDATSGSTYDRTRTITLSGSFTYVRAEIKASNGSRKAMTEPIFFRDVAELPAGDRFNVERVETPTGNQYNKTFVKGVTSSTWNAAGESLSLTLTNPARSLVTLAMAAPAAPQRVRVDGAAVEPAASTEELDAATASSWYYDAAAGMLRIKTLHAASTATMLVEFAQTTDAEPPSTPTGLSATPVSSSRVDLSWTGSTDNVGVTGYEVFRDSVKIGAAGTQPAYADATATPGTTYRYQVRAIDAAGNASPLSNAATATTPVSRLFSDGFETGDMSRWSTNNGLVAQTQHVYAGVYAARGTSAGGVTFARATLNAAQTQLYYRARFKIISQAANTVYVLRFRTSTDASIIGLYVASGGTLGYRNDIAKTSTSSSVAVSKGVWHEAQMRVRINGAVGETEVWFDGARVAALSKTESLGVDSIGRIQLGEHIAGNTYDFAFDDVAADTTFIGDALVDTTPPDTTIASGPSAFTPSTSATLAFSASEAASTFQCELDGAAFAPCSSPKSYSDLAEGGHTFAVRATDAAGNTDATPAIRSWTIDTTAPTVTATDPADGAVDVDVGASAKATFDEAIDAATITSGTVTLRRKSGGASIPASTVYDAVTQTVTIDPTADLESLTTYAATVEGGINGVRDLAGNALVADRTWTFTTTFVVDTIPPQTTIDSGPGSPTRATTATFGFSSSEGGSTFACSLDGAPYESCSAPAAYGGLSEGTHAFAVVATDSSGNSDPSPATWTWDVDGTPPETTIDSGPSGLVGATPATFSFSSNEVGSSFECSLEGSPFVACSSPKTYNGLPSGTHTFDVRALDAAGNADPTPATRSWTIDNSLFRDGFESGDFSAWTSVRTGGAGTAAVQATTVKSGQFAARLASTSGPASYAYARAAFAASHTNVTVSGDFYIAAEGVQGGTVPFFRLLDANGSRIVGVHRVNQNGDKVEVAYGNTTLLTTGTVPLNTWHRIELHVVTAGTGASTIEVRIDGTVALTRTSESLGTAGVREVQIGNDTKKQPFTLFADDLVAQS